eukprot:CAMPEP_0204519192 /NCGR_PEP_ID=MMETSP0661-20131031/4604_1 /ASSEMBLY_ACC=CAM_ASM_000606 /TAXON_ID=109239 /ORGANISM="Alexandrium margalefi, Strain AMGDE01CS-322" /LENGTH=125 /DNA_ID=CAMNT_0051524685 /DNA_START=21 /DNA_END=398 /DNA_ORIENTATION=-
MPGEGSAYPLNKVCPETVAEGTVSRCGAYAARPTVHIKQQPRMGGPPRVPAGRQRPNPGRGHGCACWKRRALLPSGACHKQASKHAGEADAEAEAGAEAEAEAEASNAPGFLGSSGSSGWNTLSC